SLRFQDLTSFASPLIPETNGPTASHNALYACRHLRRLSLCAVGRISRSHRKNRYSVPLSGLLYGRSRFEDLGSYSTPQISHFGFRHIHFPDAPALWRRARDLARRGRGNHLVVALL